MSTHHEAKKELICVNSGEFSLYLDPLFWKCILENAFLLECILKNAFSRMYFAKNSVFGKILKLFIRSDYVERNCVCLVF